MQKILFVEDEKTINKELIVGLKAVLGERVVVMPAYTISEARELLKKHRFDLAIFDIELPDGSGVDLARTIREFKVDIPMMIASAHVTSEEQVALNNELDLFLCLQKPFEVQDIVPKIVGKLEQVKNRSIQTVWVKGKRIKFKLRIDTIIKVSTVKNARRIEILFISSKTGEVTTMEFSVSCLNHFIKELPEKHGLVRINQSTMVNPHYVLAYDSEENELHLLHTDQAQTISRKYYPEARQLFTRHI